MRRTSRGRITARLATERPCSTAALRLGRAWAISPRSVALNDSGRVWCTEQQRPDGAARTFRRRSHGNSTEAIRSRRRLGGALGLRSRLGPEPKRGPIERYCERRGLQSGRGACHRHHQPARRLAGSERRDGLRARRVRAARPARERGAGDQGVRGGCRSNQARTRSRRA